ncbi:MAG: cobalamin-dependent protein, partial [Cucumibacter sp.]
DRGAHLIATAFADLGFTVVAGELFETPAEVAVRAAAAGVEAIGVSTLAAGHRTLVPELTAALKARGADLAVFCGGVIPEKDYGFLREAGVAEIFGPGTNVIAAANAVMDTLEGRRRNR